MLTVAFQMIHALHDRREVERKARGLPLFSVDGMNDKQDGYQGAQARTDCNLLIGDDLIFPIHLRLRAAASSGGGVYSQHTSAVCQPAEMKYIQPLL